MGQDIYLTGLESRETGFGCQGGVFHFAFIRTEYRYRNRSGRIHIQASPNTLLIRFTEPVQVTVHAGLNKALGPYIFKRAGRRDPRYDENSYNDCNHPKFKKLHL